MNGYHSFYPRIALVAPSPGVKPPFSPQNWRQNHKGKRLKQKKRTIKNESKIPPCACSKIAVIRLGVETVLNISKHSLRLHELSRFLRRARIFLPNQNELQQSNSYNALSVVFFATNPDSLQFAQEITRVWPRFKVCNREFRVNPSQWRLFSQSFIQAPIRENVKALRYWPFVWEFTGDRWIPRSKGQ